MTSPLISRRAALSGIAGAAALSAAPSWAKAPLQGVSRPDFYRFKLGAFEGATILDGSVQVPDPHKIFGQDQDPETVAALAQENFLPGGAMEIGFTPFLLNTGAELILFDTGNGPSRRPARGHIARLLKANGISAEAVDTVVITHFHPDHVGGLMEDGAPTFPNARYVTHRAEFDFWKANAQQRGEQFKALLDNTIFALAEKTSFLEDGQDVIGGVTAVAAHGHTPGHCAYHIESEGRRLLLCADACNHFVLSLQRPDWEVKFDMDKAAAAATRKKLFDMISTEKIPFTGYHMPFPAIGYVEKASVGYEYTPVAYQLNL